MAESQDIAGSQTPSIDYVDTVPKAVRETGITENADFAKLIEEAEEVMERCEAYSLSFRNGSPGDLCYRNKHTVIVGAYNAIQVHMYAYGFSGVLNRYYPHSNPYKQRRPCFDLNRARKWDRATPGTFIMQASPNRDEPHIACLITQYVPGRELENNELSRKHLERSSDVDFKSGIALDTYLNRLNWFKSSLLSLTELLIQREDIVRVIFPFKLGAQGVPWAVWSRDYLPTLQGVSRTLTEKGKHCEVLSDWWVGDDSPPPRPGEEEEEEDAPPPPPPSPLPLGGSVRLASFTEVGRVGKKLRSLANNEEKKEEEKEEEEEEEAESQRL